MKAVKIFLITLTLVIAFGAGFLLYMRFAGTKPSGSTSSAAQESTETAETAEAQTAPEAKVGETQAETDLTEAVSEKLEEVGVTQEQIDHALEIFDSIPDEDKQALEKIARDHTDLFPEAEKYLEEEDLTGLLGFLEENLSEEEMKTIRGIVMNYAAKQGMGKLMDMLPGR